MFLTETAALADVVLPAANLYEKSGSVTNSYGDLQQVKKAADRAGVRTDFEMIVRIADKMGARRAQARSLRQAGSSRRHGPDPRRAVRRGRSPRVWLTANNLEPRLSPFDPFAILDEIQRLVPGYDNLLRLQLLSAGNDQHLAPRAAGLVQISTRRDLVLPPRHALHLRHARPLLRHAAGPAANQPAELASRPPDRSRLRRDENR
jgi:NADH-quinone oxidoreductase subunit G